MDVGAGKLSLQEQVRFLPRPAPALPILRPWSARGQGGICLMAKGFIIRERDAEAVLQALEVIRSALLDDDQHPPQPQLAGLGVPSPPPAGEPAARGNDPESDATRVQVAREHMDLVRAGQVERYKPQPRSKPPVPRYADFMFLLAGDAEFSLADMVRQLRPFVQMHEDTRRARSSVRTALEGDGRFVKVAPGRFRKRS